MQKTEEIIGANFNGVVSISNARMFVFKKAYGYADLPSRQFLSLYYENDLNKLFANFLEDAKLSDREIDSLTKLLERKRGRTDADAVV